MASPKHRPLAFTLIELLVAVAIIALLIAILLPSLAIARNKAKAVACASNVKQIGVAYLMYTSQENKDHTISDPGSHTAFGGSWMGLSAPYRNYNDKLLLCPSAAYVAPWTNSKGTADYAWNGNNNSGASNNYTVIINPADDSKDIKGNPLSSPPASPAYVSSYGINHWTYGNYTSPAPYSSAMRMFTQVRSPGTTPILTDCVYSDTSTGSNLVPTDTAAPPNLRGANADGSPPSGNAAQRVMLNRHSMTINAVFCDGHAEKIQMADIYRQTWFDGWLPEALPFPMPPK